MLEGLLDARDVLRDPFYLRLERGRLWIWIYVVHAVLFYLVGLLIGWATTSRLVGASGWVTWFDSHGARLLIATGRLGDARDQLNLGLQLAEETGMRFYNAELLRLRAATHRPVTAGRPGIRQDRRPRLVG